MVGENKPNIELFVEQFEKKESYALSHSRGQEESLAGALVV